MFCCECGKEIANHAQVCPECGAAQAQPAEDTAAGTGKIVKKKVPKRVLLFLVAAVALAVLAVIITVVLRGGLSPKNFGRASEDVVSSHITDMDADLTGGKTLFVPEKNPGNIITLEGALQRTFYNLDFSVSGVVLGTDNVLYRIEKGKEAFIEENVAEVSLSANGKGLAFTTGDYRFDNTERSDLYLRSGTKNERISTDSVGKAVFSPSGKYLLYAEYDGKNYTLLLHNGKKTKEILSSKRRITALGVRDDGKRVYYAVKDTNGDQLQGDYTLYHYDGESFEELGGFSFGSQILFNRDLSQILFTEDKNAWFSENGQEPVKLRMGGGNLLPIVPYLTAVQYRDTTLEADIYDVRDFRNTFLLSSDTLYLFTGDEFKPLSRKVLDAKVLNDEKTLLIRKKDGGLYRLNGRKETAKEEELTADTIDYYGASGDGKTIFYITKNAELYRVQKKGAPLKLSGEQGVDAYVEPTTGKITHIGQIAFREKTHRLYFVEGGTLYTATKEGEVTAPAYGLEGDVTGVTCYRDLMEVTTLSDGTLRTYLSTDGETFTLLTDEETLSG